MVNPIYIQLKFKCIIIIELGEFRNRSDEFSQFLSLIMVYFHSNFQLILKYTFSIEVTNLAQFSLIWTMLPSPFNQALGNSRMR